MATFMFMAAVTSAACTVLLARALLGLLAVFMGVMMTAFAIFTAYFLNAWHANRTNKF